MKKDGKDVGFESSKNFGIGELILYKYKNRWSESEVVGKNDKKDELTLLVSGRKKTESNVTIIVSDSIIPRHKS